MKKQITFSLLILLLGFSSCTKQDNQDAQQENGELVIKAKTVDVPSGNALDKISLDRLVINTLETRNDFQWEWMDLKTLWSALQYGDHSLAIGYKPASAGDISTKLHTLNIKSGAYKQVHDKLIDLILEELNKNSATKISLQDILIEDDQVLPILTLRITDKNVLTRLYNLENVRYLEPLDYWPNDPNRASTGCAASTEPLNTADWTATTPNALVPWNFNNHQIPAAWNVSQGLGITVGVIDAGLRGSQTLLAADFNDGASNVGRTVTTGYTLGTSAFTGCNHGTSMSGAAVGPRNNKGGTVGVAYKSSLNFIRAADDVILDASAEKTATKNAFIQMGNNASIKIISLSMGSPFGSSVLKDGVDYAYGLGKLIFAAAGTSLTWTSWWGVIYPAAYSSCVAVTGIRDNGSTCATCHDGGKVQYTITMERAANNNRNSLSLAGSGFTPTYIGGSSVATSTTAGIAALVWSARPNMTRTQLLNCLTNTAQFYPNKNSTKGYGNLNALSAVNYAVANY